MTQKTELGPDERAELWDELTSLPRGQRVRFKYRSSRSSGKRPLTKVGRIAKPPYENSVKVAVDDTVSDYVMTPNNIELSYGTIAVTAHSTRTRRQQSAGWLVGLEVL